MEYLLIPLVFGLGPRLSRLWAPTSAQSGARALASRSSAALAFALTKSSALPPPSGHPRGCRGRSAHDQAGSAYLRIVGPTYGFFGLGLSLYFASQGAGRLAWPLLAGLLRLLIAIGGGWIALRWTGSMTALFFALALALVIYGVVLAAAVASGVWFRSRRPARVVPASDAFPRARPACVSVNDDYRQLRVRQHFLSAPSSSADIPRRPCDAITIASHLCFFAAAIIACRAPR
jgi:hypothetical protein